MTPIEPIAVHEGAKRVVFAANQPEYFPLPASVSPDGVVMTEWALTADELDRLLCGGRVRIWLHTFNKPRQPLSIEVVDPECGMRAS